MNWCDRPTCANSTRVCNDLDSDVASALKLGENYANRILLIRYEDLSIRPYQTVDKILNFLDLPPQPEFIDTYLKTHTGQLRYDVNLASFAFLFVCPIENIAKFNIIWKLRFSLRCMEQSNEKSHLVPKSSNVCHLIKSRRNRR